MAPRLDPQKQTVCQLHNRTFFTRRTDGWGNQGQGGNTKHCAYNRHQR